MRRRPMVFALATIVALATLFLLRKVDPAGVVLAGVDAGKPEPTVAQLRDEIEQLKQLLPDQAHAMHDVSGHFTNLWFAGAGELAAGRVLFR